MKEKFSILPMKALAAFGLVLGLAPVHILLGRNFLPDDTILWYFLPACTLMWGMIGFLFSGIWRMFFQILGGLLLTAWGIWKLLPMGWTALFPLLPCWVVLLMLPPAWSRPTWQEWPVGLWTTGIFLHLFGHFLSGRPNFSGTAGALGVVSALYAFLMLMTLNRLGLREGMHGAQKAPVLMRRRNAALVIGLFVPALIAACWGPLGALLDRAWNALKMFLAIVVAWLMGLFSKKEEITPDAMPARDGGGMFPLAEDVEPSWLAQILEKVFYVLAAVILVIVLYFAARILYKKLKILFQKILARLRRYASASSEDYVDELESTLNLDEKSKAWRDKLQKAFIRHPKPIPWNDLDGRGRIRRLYQQFLQKKPDLSPMTAREALKQEKWMPADRAAAFAELYERARYSDHEITVQEAEQMKKSMK